MAGNFDELKRQIELDELKDQVDIVMSGEEVEVCQQKMIVADFAKSRGLQPQLIYYYIRTHKVTQEKCVCGRWVIDIKAATEFFDGLERRKAEKRGAITS